MYNKKLKNLSQWRIQDFPEGGSNSQSGCAYLFFFGRKLHENERIRTPGGVPPLDPPLSM